MQHRETAVTSSTSDRLRKSVEQSAQHVGGGRARLVESAVDRVAAGGVRREPAGRAGEQRVDDGRAARPDAVEDRRLAGAGVDGVRVEAQLGGVLEQIDGRRSVAGAGRLHQHRPTADVHRRANSDRQRELENLQVAALHAARHPTQRRACFSLTSTGPSSA